MRLPSYLKTILLIVFTGQLVIGCGGGGGGTDAVAPTSDIKTGVFLDSPVEGLKYVTDTLTGTTDVSGTFQYREGEVVKFYINDALIGKALGASVLTPLSFSLLPPIENAPETINALRLLQTLDVDTDPTNGISLPSIDDGVGLDLNMSEEISVQTFVGQVKPGAALKDSASSLAHFSTTLENLPVEEGDVSYVFSHTYSNNNNEINTSMSASLDVINGEYVFSATLPSGYQINYQGGTIAWSSAHASILYLGQYFYGAGVGIIDPLTGQSYWISFYDAKSNTAPYCNLGGGAFTIPGVTKSVFSSVHIGVGQRMECTDRDGDYIETATFKFYLDDIMVSNSSSVVGEITNPNFFAYPDTEGNGLQLYTGGRRINPDTNIDTFSIDVAVYDVTSGDGPQLVEDHTLKVVIEAVDSRGEAFYQEEVLYQGTGTTSTTSTDTTAGWSVHQQPSGSGDDSDTLNAIAWNGSTYVAVGNYGIILTSSDGVNWVSQISNTSNRLTDVEWIQGQFVAIGDYDTYITSPNGMNWMQGNDVDLISSPYLDAINWNGSRYVILSNGVVYTSLDGMTWESDFTSVYYDIVWNGQMYVAVGYNGSVGTSVNGLDWIEQESGTGNTYKSVVWDGTRFIAAGNYSGLYNGQFVEAGNLLTSTDGINWMAKSTGASASINKIAWNGSMYLTLGVNSGYVSTDGINWLEEHIAYATFYDAVWDGSRFVAVGQEGVIVSRSGL